MNILILTAHMNQGGLARYVLNLSQGLCPEHKVWVASAGGEWEQRLVSAGADSLHIPVGIKSFLHPKLAMALARLLPFLVRHKIEIILANTRVTQFLAYVLNHCTGVPYVSVFHGFFRPSLERKLMKFEGLRTIAVSEAVKAHCTRDLGIAENQIRVVYNGIDKKAFAPFKEKKPDLRDGVVLGMLGRISREKGHFLALEAFKVLRRKYKNISFLISGRGRLEEELACRIKEAGLEKEVRLIAAEGEEFLDLIDILLFPSSQEGFGFSILEGFAKRTVVIGSAAGGIGEVIKDRETGFLFKEYTADGLADIISLVIDDPLTRQKVIDKAYACLERFSLKVMAERTADVLKEAESL